MIVKISSQQIQEMLPQDKTLARYEQLAGDASSRCYFRVFDTLGATYTLQTDKSFDELQKNYFLEAQKIFESLQIPVPKIISVSPQGGWILMEDLGNEMMQDLPKTEYFEQALKQLENAWQIDCQNLDDNLKTKIYFQWAFDFEKLQAEMLYTKEHLFEKFLKREVPDFLNSIEANSRFLANRTRVLCHRDFHSRNLMIKNEKIFWIDFQDARPGPISYDAVSLIFDPYNPLTDKQRGDLLLFWKNILQQNLSLKNKAHFLRDLEEEIERMTIQRFLKAAGSFASFFNLKNRTDYLPHIKPALNHCVNAFENLRRLQKITSSDESVLQLIRECIK